MSSPHDPNAGPGPQPGAPMQDPRQAVRGKVAAPAIFLLIVGILGLLASLYSFYVAAIAGPQPIDPNLPEWLQEIQKRQNEQGPLTIGIQVLFVLLNVCIIIGALQMKGFKSWGWGMTATILAMINIGSCCCLLGLPAGIWSLVVLLSQDVKQAFMAAPTQQTADTQRF